MKPDFCAALRVSNPGICLRNVVVALWAATVSLHAATYTVTNTTDGSTPGSLRNAFAEAGLSVASDTISFSSLFDTQQTIAISAGFSPLTKTGIITMAPSALLTVNSGNFSFLNLSGTTTYSVSNVDSQSTSASAIVVNSGAVLSVSNFDFDNMTLAGGAFRNAGTLSTTGTVALGSGGGTLDITSGTTTLSGNSLTKAGAGALTLSGSNTYNGNTTVSAGTHAHFLLIEKFQKLNLPREQIEGFEPVEMETPAQATGGVKGRRKSKKDKLREAAAREARRVSKS